MECGTAQKRCLYMSLRLPRPRTRDSKCSAYAKSVERVEWSVLKVVNYLLFVPALAPFRCRTEAAPHHTTIHPTHLTVIRNNHDSALDDIAVQSIRDKFLASQLLTIGPNHPFMHVLSQHERHSFLRILVPGWRDAGSVGQVGGFSLYVYGGHSEVDGCLHAVCMRAESASSRFGERAGCVHIQTYIQI